jgi:hypothetical protein
MKSYRIFHFLQILLCISRYCHGAFLTFTNRDEWIAAAGGSYEEETFNYFTADVSFNNGASVTLDDFVLKGYGDAASNVPSSGTRWNRIDAIPWLWVSRAYVDGTTQLAVRVCEGSSLNCHEGFNVAYFESLVAWAGVVFWLGPPEPLFVSTPMDCSLEVLSTTDSLDLYHLPVPLFPLSKSTHAPRAMELSPIWIIWFTSHCHCRVPRQEKVITPRCRQACLRDSRPSLQRPVHQPSFQTRQNLAVNLRLNRCPHRYQRPFPHHRVKLHYHESCGPQVP